MRTKKIREAWKIPGFNGIRTFDLALGWCGILTNWAMTQEMVGGDHLLVEMLQQWMNQ